MLLLLIRFDARSLGWLVMWLGLTVTPGLAVTGSVRKVQQSPTEMDPGWLAQVTGVTVTTSRDSVSADGLCSLREAIEAVNTNARVNECGVGQAIVFDSSLAGEPITLNSELAITQNVDIRGSGSDKTVLSGGGRGRVLTVGLKTTVTLRNLSITEGRADRGGGIYNLGSLVISESVLVGNTATDHGGAIFNRYDTSGLRMDRSVVTRNSAMTGGALFMLFGTAGITNSAISDNTADVGGGIYNRSGTLEFQDSSISGNIANDTGGGLYNEEGIVKFTASRLDNNQAQEGAGLVNFLGRVELMGSVVSGNVAAVSGGGILGNSSGSIQIQRSQLLNNTAAQGGAIHNIRNSIQAVETLFNTNAAQDGSAIFNRRLGQIQLQQSSIAENQTANSGSSAVHTEGILALTANTFQNPRGNVTGPATGQANNPTTCDQGNC